MKLKSILFLAGVLAVTASSCEDAPKAVRQGVDKEPVIDIDRQVGMNLVGRVRVDGQPREGVVVSDGVNVVTTDANGEYQMRTRNRQHVFVSTPADCEIPVDATGMPKHYKTIQLDDDAAIQINFDLKKRQAPVTDWTLVSMADVQIGTDYDINQWLNYCMPGTLDHVNSITGTKYGIMLGDICWNAPDLYPTYKSNIARLGFPTFSVIGNHDHLRAGTDDVTSDEDYRNALGPTYYSTNIGDWHIVVLDDVLYNGVNNYARTITTQQLEWLEKDLQYVDKSKSIIVALHIPTQFRNSNTDVSNKADLYNLVKDYHQVEILSGHWHYNLQCDIADNIHETTHGAVMGAWWNGNICNDGAPRGYCIFEFSGNELKNEWYKGSETPADYQIKIYLPYDASFRFGKTKTEKYEDAKPVKIDNENLLVNIFFWHYNWKVEVSEDGGAWKVIPNSQFAKIMDPMAVRLLQDRNPWETRQTADPSTGNDHMFLYKPANANWKTFSVRAADQYGNVWTETIENK